MIQDIDDGSEFEPDPDTHHDRMAEEAAAELFDKRAIDTENAYPIDDLSRHVVIIEPNGMAYIAPHQPKNHPLSVCENVGDAWKAFRGPLPHEPFPVPAGRYWCDVDDAGNFSIGSRLRDEPVVIAPPELCGYRNGDGETCVFLPHVGIGGVHSWEVAS